MRHALVFCLISFLLSCHTNGQDHRRDNVKLINSIDSLTTILGPPANNLVAYFKEVTIVAKNNKDYLLSEKQVDSLKFYFENLSSQYADATRFISLLKTYDSVDSSLKSSFLTVLENGKAPWNMTMPVYLKIYKNGQGSLSDTEKDIIANTATIFKGSAKAVLQWTGIVAEQEESFVKTYNLKFYNGKYQ
jgi:hypothetical protein